MKNHQSNHVSCFQLSLPSEGTKRSLFLLLLLSLFSIRALAFQVLQEKQIVIEEIESLTDSFASKIIRHTEVPGMNVAVAKNDKIIFLKSYGKADIEMDADVEAGTVFGIASVTKQFTAAAIMQLIEEDKISLNDPITKFLPDYPTQGNHVTIHHLLSHTSGIKDYGIRNEKMPHWYKIPLSYEEMLELWAQEPFDFEPGEKYDYSNFNYYLLGQILERVAGKSWLEYAEPELLQPLGLDNIFFSRQDSIIPGRAKPYLHLKNKMINLPYRDISFLSAGGGLSATITDLLTWTRLLHSGEVVSFESLEKMTSPTVLNNGKKVGYGYGLYVNELRGHKKIYHGGTFGFGAYVAHYPAEDITIAILSNSSKGRERAEQLEEIIATAVLDIEIKEVPLTAEEISRYTGSYSYQSTPTKVRELKVFGENGRLLAQIGDNRAFALRFQGNHEFIPVVNGITNINFIVEQGKAVGLTIHEGAWEITPARKIQIN